MSYSTDLSWRMSVLFSDDIENRFLDMKQTILCPLHTGQLGIQHTQLLHLEHFIVAGPDQSEVSISQS